MQRQGSVYRRCDCRDPRTGHVLGATCPQLKRPRHGSWHVSTPATVRGDGLGRIPREGFATRREAEAVLATLLTQPAPAPGGVTVGQWLETWLADSTRRLRPTTVRGYRQHLDCYLDVVAQLPLVDLTRPVVQLAFDDLIARQEKAGKPLSAASVHQIRATLRSALSAAVRAELISTNPARNLQLPRAPRPHTVVWTPARVERWRSTNERPAVAVWTPEGTAAFLAAICGHRLYALFHLLALRGLRRGEALGLQWSDLDLSAATLVIDRQLQQRTSGGGVITLEPKTRAGHRWIALDRGTLTALRTHQAHQAREREAAGPAWCDTGFVFTDLHGHPLMPDHITHLFQKLLTAHDLPPIRLHDLRHGAATLAMNAGVPMRIVQHQIGHESIATTADIYSAVLPAAAQEAAETTARIVQRAARTNRRKFATSGRNRPATSPRSLRRRVKVRRPRNRR